MKKPNRRKQQLQRERDHRRRKYETSRKNPGSPNCPSYGTYLRYKHKRGIG